MAISSSSTFYTLIYKLCDLAFFSLLNPYVCPSHLSNYLLTWNTLLATFFLLFLSASIVCVSDSTTGSYIVVRPARGIPFDESSFADVEVFFTRSEFDPNYEIS